MKKEEEALEHERQRAMTMEEQLTAGNKQMQVCQVSGTISLYRVFHPLYIFLLYFLHFLIFVFLVEIVLSTLETISLLFNAVARSCY